MTDNEMLVSLDVILNLLLECPYIPKDKKLAIDRLRYETVSKAIKAEAYSTDNSAKNMWSCMESIKDFIKETLEWEPAEPFRKSFWER